MKKWKIKKEILGDHLTEKREDFSYVFNIKCIVRPLGTLSVMSDHFSLSSIPIIILVVYLLFGRIILWLWIWLAFWTILSPSVFCMHKIACCLPCEILQVFTSYVCLYTVWNWWKKYPWKHCCRSGRHAIQWADKFWNCFFVEIWVFSNATSRELIF